MELEQYQREVKKYLSEINIMDLIEEFYVKDDREELLNNIIALEHSDNSEVEEAAKAIMTSFIAALGKKLKE